MNERSLQTRSQHGGNQKVVNAPANVLLAHPWQRTPPGIMPPTRFKFPKSVNKSGIQKCAEPGPFFSGETMSAHIVLRICQIQFAVSHVEIPTKNDRLLPF